MLTWLGKHYTNAGYSQGQSFVQSLTCYVHYFWNDLCTQKFSVPCLLLFNNSRWRWISAKCHELYLVFSYTVCSLQAALSWSFFTLMCFSVSSQWSDNGPVLDCPLWAASSADRFSFTNTLQLAVHFKWTLFCFLGKCASLLMSSFCHISIDIHVDFSLNISHNWLQKSRHLLDQRNNRSLA